MCRRYLLSQQKVSYKHWFAWYDKFDMINKGQYTVSKVNIKDQAADYNFCDGKGIVALPVKHLP